MKIKEEFEQHIYKLQNDICQTLETIDGKSNFIEDRWDREGGGGGRTRVIENGYIFEKGGVNVSSVNGLVTDIMRKSLNIDAYSFYASGLSLVIHPLNPFVPTVHANIRHFQLLDNSNQLVDSWFGGGMDLTPYYLFEDDAKHFHHVLKQICDRFNADYYQSFKKQCDQYFYNSHRDESRGIGGIFFDHLRKTDDNSLEDIAQFTMAVGSAFISAYAPIVEKRKHMDYQDHHKYWQEIRRGRYVEFNLIHDKGTLFGLKTNGRTESILMSLPPKVRWDYNYRANPNSEEANLLEVLKNPIDWI